MFTPHELAVIAGALDFMACESTLRDRRPILEPHTADLSSAPLVRLADRARLAGAYGAVAGLAREAGEDFYGLS